MGVLLLKRTNRILPVYAADISGICLALYELDGVTAIHDTLGCSSTYTTHGELRQYSMDSMVCISAPSELETVMEDDEKLAQDTVDAVLNLCLAFICIRGAPIPAMTGTDFKGVTRMIENKTGIPTSGIVTNGMYSYVRGAGEVLRWTVKRFCPFGIKADRSAALRVNILGATPLDLSSTGNTARLKDFFRSHGMETVGCWAMESGPGKLWLTGLADINLAVLAVGLPAAAELKEMHGTPWVVGTPVGRRTSGRLAEYIRQAARTGENQSLFDSAGYVAPRDADTCIRPDLGLAGLPEDLSDKKVPTIGEQVTAGSPRRCLREEWGADRVTVFCPTGGKKALALKRDIIDWDEDEVTCTIVESIVVVTDPLYRQVCSARRNTVSVDSPHETYSGRMYHSIMRPFVCTPDDPV